MGERNIEIDYDADEDILYIAKSAEKVKFSVDISIPKGDIVIDFDYRGLISGIEIFNASAHFPLAEGKFSEIKQASLNVNYGPRWLLIQLSFHIPGIEQPLTTNIYSPYNKRLILAH